MEIAPSGPLVDHVGFSMVHRFRFGFLRFFPIFTLYFLFLINKEKEVRKRKKRNRKKKKK